MNCLTSVLLILVVSFAVSPATVTLFEKKEEISLIKGNNLTTLPSFPEEYIISFEVNPTSYSGDWQSVIHITPGDDIGYAERNPAIFFDSKGILVVMSPINESTQTSYIKSFPLNVWTKVEISQLLFGENYIYSISVNETSFYTTLNYDAQNFTNLILYASDDWYESLSGTIRYLTISQLTRDLNSLSEQSIFYKPQVYVNYSGFLDSTLLTLNLSIQSVSKPNETVFNLTLDYLLPPFIKRISNNTTTRFEEVIDSLHLKLKCVGLVAADGSVFYSLKAMIDVSKVPNTRKFNMTIPVNVSFKNVAGKTWLQYKSVRIEINLPDYSSLKIINSSHVLSESYGRGIYWDSTNLLVYVCMNQHVTSTESACFYSNNRGQQWADLDVRVGSILGHHSLTAELYGIHRNRKTYLMFRNAYKKWFALTYEDFTKYANNYIDQNMRKKLDGEGDQIYTLGPYQWMGNIEGLFYRKFQNDSWVQRVKWSS